VVCEYYPPGNVIGAFDGNVQSQVNGSAGDTVESGLGNSAASISAHPVMLGLMLLGILVLA
jgi:hypothetical protein